MSPKKLICLFVTVIHNCVVKGDVFFFFIVEETFG